MTTVELLDELNRLRAMALALTQEIEKLQRKIDQQGAPAGGAQKRVPSLQMPAVRASSRPPKK